MSHVRSLPKSESSRRGLPHSTGFTLIELIMVMVILGVIAAVAIPRYASLRRQGIISSMRGLDGALKSAATMAHAKAIIAGSQNLASATIVVSGTSIDMVYGYPDGTASGIARLVETPAGDWKQRASTVYAGAWVYWHGVITEDAGTANCYLRYYRSTGANTRPVIDFVSTGCK